jgi:hypothetical protein
MTTSIHFHACLLLILLVGCRANPTRILTFPSPSPEVTYTVEAWEDKGAISSDFTRVFANFDHDGKHDRIMFLDGAYLKISGVRWNGRNEATICIAEGRVNSFQEDISLSAGGAIYKIRNRIDENCHADPKPE